MSQRQRTDLRRLLRHAVRYVQADTDVLEECHLSPVSGKVEPYSVRRMVEAKRRWLSQAKAALQ